METLLQAVFWSCVAGTLIPYALFPMFLKILAGNKRLKPTVKPASLPAITFLISAYNEKNAITAKIKNCYDCDYPVELISVILGSDASNDGTNEIITDLQKTYPTLRLVAFEKRTGKPDILNRLVELAPTDVLILTDAKIFLAKDYVQKLVCRLLETNVGFVSASVLGKNRSNNGVSFQESKYASYEANIKYYESVLWGTAIGASGQCYTIFKKDYHPTPQRFIAEDFYITLQILLEGKMGLLDIEALAYTSVSNEIKREFRRKARISAGNFQNLFHFPKLLCYTPKPSLSFCYWGHKV